MNITFFRKLISLLLIFFSFTLFAFANTLFVPEPKLQNALARALSVEPAFLTRDLVSEKLEFFELNNVGLRDLTGLEAAKNLKVLVLKDNLIENIEPLTGLSHLRKLDLSGNRISNLSALSGFSLTSMRNQISEIQKELSVKPSPELLLSLSTLNERIKSGPWQLNELSLSRNRLLGLSGISSLTYLEHLDVSGNALIDLEGVSSLSSLVTLYAQGNQLGRVENFVDENKNKIYDIGESFDDESGNGKRDTDPLSELKDLQMLLNLHLYNNLISSVRSLQNLPRLKILLLSGNEIQMTDNLGNLHSLERLSLSDNRITSLSGLEHLENLEFLYLVENRICDLRPISRLKKLRELRLQRNQLVSMDSLSGLSELSVLSISNNFIFSLEPIEELKKLQRISITGNYFNISDSSFKDIIKKLKNRGVFITIGSQKERKIELEQLISSLIGHPSSNQELGNYLQSNGYLRLVDFVDDSSLNETEKINSYNSWHSNLKSGNKLSNLTFPKK